MTNIKNSYSQRGVALLFALGVLSLLLVMGVAFLGNALISQNIAVNSQEASSAKSLARTAVDRALAHLTLFQLIQSREINNSYTSDASSVFSRTTADKAISVPDNSTRRDLLYYTDTTKKSRLSVSRGKEGTQKWYDGSKSLAEWVYVHADGTFSDGQGTGSNALGTNEKRIVGRFAYQVLPQTSTSRLSLWAVTSGASREVGKNLVSGTTARIPQKHRWGVEVDELVIPDIDVNKTFSKYWKHDSSDLCDPLHEFDNFINIFSGKVGDANINPLYNDDEKSENYKRWLEYIFAEGRGRIAREAYWGGNGWYPRFNLGEFKHYVGDDQKRVSVWNTSDTWYQRFLEVTPTDAESETKEIEKIKNSDKAVEFLTGGTSLKDPGKLQQYTDSFLFDGQYDILGIPFLRRIGHKDEKGAFDTIANLRKQIAANLNDYCDADSIPTSDKAADEWKNLIDETSADRLPAYTGNEKTPYINEIGFEFKLDNASVKIENGGCVFSADELKARIMAELIGVYQGLDLKKAELLGILRSMELKLAVSISGKVKVRYTLEDGAASTDKETEVEFSGANNSGNFSFTFPGSNNSICDNFKEGANGYWIGCSKGLTAASSEVKILLTDSVKTKVKDNNADLLNVSTDKIKLESFSSDSDVSVQVTAKSINFEFSNLVLKYQDNKTNPDDFEAVDFVRVAPGKRDLTGEISVFSVTAKPGELAESLREITKKSNTEAENGFFYCGSMQAIDPRQNLFANGIDSAVSDWTTVFVPSFGQDKASRRWTDKADISLMIVNKEGGVNVCSNPKEPKNADGTAMTLKSDGRYLIDPEIAADPAWKGTGKEEHLSTAVIRNAPMRSPWELGFIHRGIPFQTINLKEAGGIDGGATLDDEAHKPENFKTWANMGSDGTRYRYGDAGILDQIKMTEFTKSYGKVDFSALRKKPENWSGDTAFLGNLKLQLFKSLFENLKSHEASVFVDKVKDWDKAPQIGEESNLAISLDDTDLEKALESDSKLRSKVLANDHFVSKFEKATDAASEEVIGKTINLIEGEGCSLPNVFKIVVVAQTILDADGATAKLDSSGNVQNTSAKFGKFDATIASNGDIDSNMYFDDILSEARMLVTVEKLHYTDGGTPRARLRVKQIEYLD